MEFKYLIKILRKLYAHTCLIFDYHNSSYIITFKVITKGQQWDLNS